MLVRRSLFPTHVGMDRSTDVDFHGETELFPTHVGMDRDAVIASYQIEPTVPHARGDGPVSRTLGGPQRSPVPHARGDGPSSSATFGRASSLFPTHVGMDRRRTCSLSSTILNCSPRTWGWTD